MLYMALCWVENTCVCNFEQDGLISMVDEMNQWPASASTLPTKISSAIYTLKYCNKYYVTAASAVKSGKAGATRPLSSVKFGHLFRFLFLFCMTNEVVHFMHLQKSSFDKLAIHQIYS